MLAARDQENLVHVHQTAAASKPLNQGTRTLLPKTPGNKVPKTPFKIPLNDKTGNTVLGGGKNGLKARAGGNENLVTRGNKEGNGDKTAFVTPLGSTLQFNIDSEIDANRNLSGTRNRAPLGLKTTNAKAKPFQTPATSLVDNEAKKAAGKGVQALESKPKVSHGEASKLEFLGDLKNKDEREEEIEYMPPRAKELPDLPDDMPHEINLSMFNNGVIQPGFLHHFVTRVGPDGLTFYERKEKEQQRVDEIAHRITEATLTRDFESLPFPCVHQQECPGEECSESIANRQAAEMKYQKIVAALSKQAKNSNPISKRVDLTSGPSTLKSKSAATALSQPNQAPSPLKGKPTTKISPPSKTSTIFSRPKKAPPQPTNPSPMRHTAASALSKTTIGHSRGRATSAAMRKSVRPAKDTNKTAAAAAEIPDPTLAPAIYIERYGVPRIGSDQWVRCDRAGCFKEEGEQELEDAVGSTKALDDLLREEAEKDFQLL